MQRKKHIFIFVLIIASLLFANLIMYTSLNSEYAKAGLLINYLANLPGCILMGILDFFIIDAVYKKGKWKDNGVRVFIDLLLTSTTAVLLGLIVHFLLLPDKMYDYLLKFTLPLILWNSIVVLLIEIFFYNRRQAEAERKLATAEQEKLRYQYETLKAQINPHFLFNSLNVLSSLAYQDAEKTNLFAKKMSGVYRYLLQTKDRPVVTLKEELAFLESYLFLEQIRFENALFVEISGSEPYLNRMVIPVSLQLLVENAIKHNITTVKTPLKIRIDIAGKGITVSNNLKLRSSVDKGGVGLDNVQKQYALHNKVIHISKGTNDYTVNIPFID